MDLLEVKDLVKIYNGRRVVNGLSLSVGRSEIVGLLGPNGAGKTTSFYMAVGIVKPDEGKIFFDQEDITTKPIHERCRLGMGYLAQEPSIFRKLTVEENIMAVLETLDIGTRERKRRLESLLEELNISHLARSKAYTQA
jgi:lipopolysaccharide export system ATP-binding protein